MLIRLRPLQPNADHVSASSLKVQECKPYSSQLAAYIKGDGGRIAVAAEKVREMNGGGWGREERVTLIRLSLDFR